VNNKLPEFKPSAMREMVVDALDQLGLDDSPDNVIVVLQLVYDVLAYVSGEPSVELT
jgi:hypothetical protein